MSVPADQVLADSLTPKTPMVPMAPVVQGQVAPKPVAAKPAALLPETDIQRAERLSREAENYEQSTEVAARQKEIKRQNDLKELEENQLIMARQNLARVQREAANRMEHYAQRIEMQGVMPEYKETFQKQAPVAMILMALLGKAAKVPGMAMLQGSTGMMQGLQQADMNAYNRAREQYIDGVNQLTTVANTWNKVYDMRIKAAGNDVLAQQDAIDLSLIHI